jgi:hypothetical protein
MALLAAVLCLPLAVAGACLLRIALNRPEDR